MVTLQDRSSLLARSSLLLPTPVAAKESFLKLIPDADSVSQRPHDDSTSYGTRLFEVLTFLERGQVGRRSLRDFGRTR